MKTCSCNESLGNTGLPGCHSVAKVTKKLIIVPTFDSTGAKNKLAVATQLTDVIVDGLINQTDATKRWYPLPVIENVTNTRADSTFETAPSGKKAKIKQGIRSFTAEIWDEAGTYKNQIDAIGCKGASVYLVDLDGSIRGLVAKDSDTYLYPIKIDKQSWDVRVIEATDTTVAKLMVSFDFDQNEDDALLRMIAADDMTCDLLDKSGLLDVSIDSNVATTTSLAFKLPLKAKFGSMYTPFYVSGLTAADFTVFNNTTSAAVTVLTATENTTTNTYTLTFVAQTAGDILVVTPSQNGYDFSDVISTSTVI